MRAPVSRQPARALRKCAGCGQLVTDTQQAGDSWVCRADSCTPVGELQPAPVTRDNR